jgi:hypothetical protein
MQKYWDNVTVFRKESWKTQVIFIDSIFSTGKPASADFCSSRGNPLVCAIQKLHNHCCAIQKRSNLCRFSSLKVGQPTPLSSKAIGQPLFTDVHVPTEAQCFPFTWYKRWKGAIILIVTLTRCFLFIKILSSRKHYPRLLWQCATQSTRPYHTFKLSIVGTNKELKWLIVYFIPEYCLPLVTWYFAGSQTLHISTPSRLSDLQILLVISKTMLIKTLKILFLRSGK